MSKELTCHIQSSKWHRPISPEERFPLAMARQSFGAVGAIRALIDAIRLEPDGDELKITLTGALAGMLSAARDTSWTAA